MKTSHFFDVMCFAYVELFFVKISFVTVAIGSQCLNKQAFILKSDINETRFEGYHLRNITDDANRFLLQCVFIRMENLSPGMCEKACSLHLTCLAYHYGDGCDLCATEGHHSDRESHNVVGSNTAEIYIGLDRFQEFISG